MIIFPDDPREILPVNNMVDVKQQSFRTLSSHKL